MFFRGGGAYEKSECLYRDNEQALRFLGETPSAVSVGGIAGLPDDTAYLRVDEFYGRAAAEAGRCLSYFKNSKKSRLILDLRSNGGGYLQTFLDLAAYFLRGAAGSRPFAAEARYKSGRTEKYYASGNFYGDYFGEDAEIYLLADENTASASECFIGALISYETLPYSHIYLRKGETARTYGKGIMQMHYTDPNGNVLKLTTAEIFWPNGKSIHGVGVTEQDGGRFSLRGHPKHRGLIIFPKAVRSGRCCRPLPGVGFFLAPTLRKLPQRAFRMPSFRTWVPRFS